MPVSTRSQISGGGDEPNIGEQARLLRNPHHRLKEKLKALTVLYEQHLMVSKKDPIHRSEKAMLSTHHPSVDLLGSNSKGRGGGGGRREERVIPLVQSNFSERSMVFHGNEDLKENQQFGRNDQISEYSCPKKATLVISESNRKFSIGSQTETRAVRMVKPGGEVKGDNENNVGARILVFVRLRPMTKKEKEAGSRFCVKIVDRKDVYLTEYASELDYLRLKRLRGRHFCFDAAFPDSTTQQEVYTTTTAEIVEGVLQGRNGSVFCYGATGAGKTYTMLGTLESPGVMVLAIKDLFNKIRQRSFGGTHSVHLSYLEVYNETVRDLLSPGRALLLREDKQGILAAGLTHYRAYSIEEVMSLLQQGNLNRTTEPTRVNQTSSRSHAILQVSVEYRKQEESGEIIDRAAKLSLIDLAGSERALATDLRTQRSVEGANINKSLLALSSCINALVEGKKHIPFRNSKLTQLLKDSLGGPCNTVMIANISPSSLSFGETQNTLHWADRAKEIRTKACTANEEVKQLPENSTVQAKLVLELQEENSKLRQKLAHQKQKMLEIQVQNLAHNSSPSPSFSKTNKKASILSGSCFITPESSKKNGAGANEKNLVVELQNRVRTLEAEMEKMKKDHVVELKHKDEYIRGILARGSGGDRRVVTRASLRKMAERAAAAAGEPGEMKSPLANRLRSPVHGSAKKRTFWDITASNSPSIVAANGRKTRSHVAYAAEVTAPAPSMLLQPGFGRQRTEVLR